MAMTTTRNCPFYGRAMYAQMMLPFRFLLLNTVGNQCGLVTDRHAPCSLEINGEEVDWKACPRVKDIRMEEV